MMHTPAHKAATAGQSVNDIQVQTLEQYIKKVEAEEAPKPENPFVDCGFRTYSEKAMSYRLPSADAIYARENLASEVGEYLGHVAKERRDGPYSKQGQEQHVRAIKKELGDILWCLAAVAADHGTSLEECALINLVKLRDRKTAGTINGSGDDR